ncbi:MAG TPA: polysaccharide biosynthesis/export family protein [Pyrinomonadaceae bacterium]|jgi:polysaccharide export outer membrane protein|nr:polysaccharide biosynthesis/export family protein [Pyrinomonadaceae bacterium]
MNHEIFGRRFVALLVLLAACLGVSFSVHAQQPEPTVAAKTEAPVARDDSKKPPMAPVRNDEDRYRIGPGDVLDIRILNRPNLSREAVRVEGNGVIRMPLIDDEIQAACKTEGELSREIAEKYTKFYRKPQVDVFIKEYHSRQVAVIGAVNEQSRFELQRRVRLLELLSYAKGTAPKAGQTINVVHAPGAYACQKGGDPAEATGFSSYKLSDTLLGDPRANPYIEPGDIVTVPEANLIYVVGNVYTPLTIPLKEPITLSRAVAMAGGIRQDSKKDKVRIVRQETATGTSREIVVDLNAIEKKRAEDIALLPNDIIDVPTSGSKTFLRSLLGTVAPSLTQLPVRIVP